MVVRTENNQFHLFVFDDHTHKPASIAIGSLVRVTSRQGAEPDARIAETVTILEAPTAPAKPGTGAAASADPIPREVRQLESDIVRYTKRFRAGVRAGTTLDSELFMFGAHAQMGPLFRKDVWFRPNIELGFGEVTTMVGINLEAIYRLPVSQRQARWSTYMGAGPSFNFLHQDFERDDGDNQIDFGDFEYKTGFNLLMGLQLRRGTFFEIKTSIYSRPAPTLRLILGHNF
jgi:hypothetical protein